MVWTSLGHKVLHPGAGSLAWAKLNGAIRRTLHHTLWLPKCDSRSAARKRSRNVERYQTALNKTELKTSSEKRSRALCWKQKPAREQESLLQTGNFAVIFFACDPPRAAPLCKSWSKSGNVDSGHDKLQPERVQLFPSVTSLPTGSVPPSSDDVCGNQGQSQNEHATPSRAIQNNKVAPQQRNLSWCTCRFLSCM